MVSTVHGPGARARIRTSDATDKHCGQCSSAGINNICGSTWVNCIGRASNGGGAVCWCSECTGVIFCICVSLVNYRVYEISVMDRQNQSSYSSEQIYLGDNTY